MKMAERKEMEEDVFCFFLEKAFRFPVESGRGQEITARTQTQRLESSVCS